MNAKSPIPVQVDAVNLVEEITSFKTSYGKLYHSRNAAEYAQFLFLWINWANARLESGDSVGAILQESNREYDPILDHVTRHSMLSIPHWQCRDQPGYKLRRFESDFQIYVHGNVESWTGVYGNTMTISELARYAKSKLSILSPA